MILRIILYIMAAVSVWYSYMIYRVHSGTGFFIVWTVIGLVTNEFHMYRAIWLCKKNGLKNVCPIPADSDPFYKPNNYLREVLAYIKDRFLS